MNPPEAIFTGSSKRRQRAQRMDLRTQINRRRYLTTLSATGCLTIAGCSSSGEEFSLEYDETGEYDLEFDVSSGSFFDDTALFVDTTSRVVNDGDYLLLHADDEQIDWEPLREVGRAEYSLAEHPPLEAFVLEVIEGGSVSLDVHNGGTVIERIPLSISD